MLSFTLWMFTILYPLAKTHGMEGSADFLWEQRKIDDKRNTLFTQKYDVIFFRRLPPLYDAGLKLEFRSETRESEGARERAQALPSLNMRLGHQMMDVNLGWSKDYISGEKSFYKSEKGYTSFAWRPKWLPQILCQFQDQKEDREKGNITKQKGVSVTENYSLIIGFITLDHSYNYRRWDNSGKVTATHDLLNSGRIGQRFSFFNERLNIGTGYEVSQSRDKEVSQNMDKEEEGLDKKTLEQNAHINIDGKVTEWMKPGYRLFMNRIETDHPDDKDSSIGHIFSLSLDPEFAPYNIPITLGMNYNRSGIGPGFEPREATTYSLKIDPQLKGLIFDSNKPMYPIKTSFLISSYTDKIGETKQNHRMSFLLTGSTTIYQGVDLAMDIGLTETKNFISDAKSVEKRVNNYFTLNLLPNLKASISQRSEWNTDSGKIDGGTDSSGNLETKLVYRPVTTFMLDVGYTSGYGGDETSYQYSFNWRPNSRLEFDVSYRSAEAEPYFLGGMDINITSKLRLDLQYQYPSKEQILKLGLTLQIF
ncbi:MAG: hypothetical protein JXA79_12675 [Deltaproteobacteria bacterium]|nr:hypothetical protein [Deltaproteobacteria bacterium]